MRKGFRNFCNGNDSTSTLDQQPQCYNMPADDEPRVASPLPAGTSSERSRTLEEMILQLELEEEIARKAKQLNDYAGLRSSGCRMSSVSSSDILRLVRNALRQYPRFSLDGKDAMYRSSFWNVRTDVGSRKSVCCDQRVGERMFRTGCDSGPALGRESVVWCKPGVVAKLMGLDAMPVPIRKRQQETLGSIMRRQNLRRRAERHEMERRFAIDHRKSKGIKIASCLKSGGYCVMKPVAVETDYTSRGWPTRRLHLKQTQQYIIADSTLL